MKIPANDHWMERRLFHLTLLITLISGLIPWLSATPVITGVVNAANYKDPRLPGASIAPGSIFMVTGTGLGPANIVVAPAAFQSTSLSGTSVKVRQWQNGGRAHVLHLGHPGSRAAALQYTSRRLG